MAQGADLEHVGIVPSLPQRRVGEDESGRLLEAQQPLFVLQDQVVSTHIVRETRLSVDLAIRQTIGLLVDREIALMHLLGCEATQIGGVVLLPQIQFLIDQAGILLLKEPLENAFHLIPLRIVASVFRHLVDKEERQALDPSPVELPLLLEVRQDRLSDLHPLQGQFIGITDHLSPSQGHAIQEGDKATRLYL